MTVIAARPHHCQIGALLSLLLLSLLPLHNSLSSETMARLLLGPRARAQYPRRRFIYEDDAPYHIPNSPATRRGHQASLFSRQSLLILSIGILFGYLLLPVLLVQRLDFNDLPSTSYSKHPTTAFSEMTASPVNRIHVDPIGSNTARVRGNTKPEAITIPRMNERNLTPIDNKDYSKIEQRLVEEANILAQQSLPTSLTPYVMKTPYLPDHHRKKILVTGGAGFVGSHLVDKLMMEGHEVTVVDNFFTGQKKNIAHWLHHPNFR